MKKYFLGLLAFMFVSAITLSATSYSKSDTEEPGDNGGNGSNISSRIVGTWYCGESADDFDMMYSMPMAQAKDTKDIETPGTLFTDMKKPQEY